MCTYWAFFFASSLIAWRWVGPQTKWWLPPQSNSDGRRWLSISVVKLIIVLSVFFLEFWLRHWPFALFHHMFLMEYVSLWCFTDEVDPYADWTYTCICNLKLHLNKVWGFDPLKPHFYMVKLGFTGVHIIFLMFAQKHRLLVLVRTASPHRGPPHLWNIIVKHIP